MLVAIDHLKEGNYKTAYYALVPLHEKGIAEASFNLGLMHLNGDLVEKDRAQAIAYLTAASENGWTEATFILGTLYRESDPALYAVYERLAAEQGHLIAAQQIGLAYYEGHGVPKDPVLAYKWLFSLQMRAAAGVETWTGPLAELESSLEERALERGRVLAWNFVYIDCRCGYYQEAFEQNNPGLEKRINSDNYEIIDGQLFVQ